MTATVPPLVERQKPGLSQSLTGPLAPDRCQSCGAAARAASAVERAIEHFGNAAPGLERWVECDPWDRPTRTIVVLCSRCARRLIEPHARLYVPVSPDEPRPGCMPLCLDCPSREGVRCSHPDAKANGGTGVRLHFKNPPSRVHICLQGPRGRRGEWRTMYGPVLLCEQKEAAHGRP